MKISNHLSHFQRIYKLTISTYLSCHEKVSDDGDDIVDKDENEDDDKYEDDDDGESF